MWDLIVLVPDLCLPFDFSGLRIRKSKPMSSAYMIES